MSDPPRDLRNDLITALVMQLVDKVRVDALSWLCDRPEKFLSKAARTGLHQLRSRKVDVHQRPSAASRPPRT